MLSSAKLQIYVFSIKREKSLINMGDDGRSISRNVAHLNILAHDVINLLYSDTEQTSKNIFTYIKPDDGRSISRKVAHLNILVHDVINLLYYEY